MPLDSSVQATLRTHYGPYPGPDADLFSIGERVSQFLTDHGVTTEGASTLLDDRGSRSHSCRAIFILLS
jgi:hypothetical protein